ncbi:hypothetical protein H9P43_008696 [Blastocladiella emersonii ATCC 22665]|nr:hypothetical protein H9P43_008696 [Blastocladiella emersonii ATCC 22665]
MSVHDIACTSTFFLRDLKFLRLHEPLPDVDPRFPTPLYNELRPVLKRILITAAYPVNGSGMDSLGPALKAFLDKGI